MHIEGENENRKARPAEFFNHVAANTVFAAGASDNDKICGRIKLKGRSPEVVVEPVDGRDRRDNDCVPGEKPRGGQCKNQRNENYGVENAKSQGTDDIIDSDHCSDICRLKCEACARQ